MWNEPIAEPCPKCGWPVLTLKTTRSKGTAKVCPQKDCGYSETYEAVDAQTPQPAQDQTRQETEAPF